jgi:DNA-binding GntR family transcriptional regulator
MEQHIERQQPLANQVHTALCEAIATGKLIPGEQVVIEHVAAWLGVSATPVREAIASCLQDGLIQRTPDGKLQVVPLTREYVLDVFLVRRALEGLAAEVAAEHVSESDIEELCTLMSNTTTALAHGDYDAYIAADALLHAIVISRSGSQMLARELEVLRAHVAYIRGYSQRRIGEHLQNSHEEHIAIVDALAQRDAVMARQTMEAHIQRAGRRIVQLISFDQEGTDACEGRYREAAPGTVLQVASPGF